VSPTNDKMSCAEFQQQMPELVGSGQKLSEHAHYQQCERCQALMRDLEAIAEAARQLLPPVDPPDQLWAQIESAIRSEEDRSSDN